ncbi:MAG: DNA-directed polymerase specialized sigma subunit [Oscillospiraceae bacterium]|nr:DNA-directed polymerase specialized sigma subunit [Oscillospiraceae bacterium]
MTNEEMALIIRQGDNATIEPRWAQLQQLIVMCAGRFFNRMQGACAAAGVDEEDLIQTGFFALLDAVQAYDPASGYKLTAYLRYPLQNRFNELLGLRTLKARNDPLNHCASLDEPAGDEGDTTLLTLVKDENAHQPFEAIIHSEWCLQLRALEEDAISEYLTESQAAAVRGEFFEGLALEAIADRLGVTREQARQLRQYGLHRMRSGKALRKLRIFLTDEYRALGLRGTGLSAFRYGGSSIERAVETLERRQLETGERANC